VTVVARFKEYEDWLVESSHKLHGKGKNEALKEEKLAQVSFRVCLLFFVQGQYRYRTCPCDLPVADCTVFTFLANPIVRYISVHTVSGHCYLFIFCCLAIRILIILRSGIRIRITG
jgi:hypothetical protein